MTRFMFSLVGASVAAGVFLTVASGAFAEGGDQQMIQQRLGRPQSAMPAGGFFDGLFPQRVPQIIDEGPVASKEAESKSERQYPVASIYEDATLRPGDMVVTAEGVRVFVGRPGSAHTPSDFAPVRQASLPKSERTFIAQIDRQMRQDGSEMEAALPPAEARPAIKVASRKTAKPRRAAARPDPFPPVFGNLFSGL